MSIVNADERQKGQEDRSMKSHERQKEQGGWPEDGGGRGRARSPPSGDCGKDRDCVQAPLFPPGTPAAPPMSRGGS